MGKYLQHNSPNGNCIDKILECWKDYPVTYDIVCTEQIDFFEHPQNIYPVKYEVVDNKFTIIIQK